MINNLETEQLSRRTLQSPSSQRRAMPWVLGALAGALLTIVLVAMISVGFGVRHLLRAFRDNPTHINVDQPTVVRQIQSLQRLETVSYAMDKIISGEDTSGYWPKFLVGDRLLLLVHGEVVGGINLAELSPGDVRIHDQQISIHLPAAQVFATRLDNARTKVYSRETGLFSSPDPNLESEVREEAERQLQQAALQDGILKTASDNARSTISSMLRGFGFREVEVDIR